MYCPKCYKMNEDGAEICSNCGHSLKGKGSMKHNVTSFVQDSEAIKRTQEAYSGAVNKIQDKMAAMRCPNCGMTADAGTELCPNCGSRLEETAVRKAVVGGYEAAAMTAKKVSGIPRVKRLGLLIGTLLIIIGITRILGAGYGLSYTTFGGDYQTYTYRGIYAIAQMVESLEVSLGWVIVAIGAAIDVHVLCWEKK